MTISLEQRLAAASDSNDDQTISATNRIRVIVYGIKCYATTCITPMCILNVGRCDLCLIGGAVLQ